MIDVSIVILTFNRNDHLARLLAELDLLMLDGIEVIVVDNASTVPAAEVTRHHTRVRLIRSSENLGATGRNLGLAQARGRVIITLDDDVRGLTDTSITRIRALFENERLGAANFKVIEEGTGAITNWVHHREPERYADLQFDTYEITEGAVALSSAALRTSGLYPERFFISHEGPDLAYRILDAGYTVIYTPQVSVVHAYAPAGRASWRNYYYDTRNTVWLAIRNLPFGYGARVCTRQLGAMLIYSIRDGFFLWWVRAIWHAIRGIPASLAERRCINGNTLARIKAMDRERPSLLYLIRRRLLQKGVKI